jgi:Predicted membrane protein
MSSIIQIALAFIAVLVVPGFAMSLAFFPRLNQLEVTERLAISIGLSITILVTLGLLMGYTQSLINLTGGITAYSLLAALTLVTIFFLIFLIVWALRAAGLAVKDRRKVVKPRKGA